MVPFTDRLGISIVADPPVAPASLGRDPLTNFPTKFGTVPPLPSEPPSHKTQPTSACVDPQKIGFLLADPPRVTL